MDTLAVTKGTFNERVDTKDTNDKVIDNVETNKDDIPEEQTIRTIQDLEAPENKIENELFTN